MIGKTQCKIKSEKETIYCNCCTTPNIRNKKWYCPKYRVFLVKEGEWLVNEIS